MNAFEYFLSSNAVLIFALLSIATIFCGIAMFTFHSSMTFEREQRLKCQSENSELAKKIDSLEKDQGAPLLGSDFFAEGRTYAVTCAPSVIWVCDQGIYRAIIPDDAIPTESDARFTVLAHSDTRQIFVYHGKLKMPVEPPRIHN
jgi:hypothetical protein